MCPQGPSSIQPCLALHLRSIWPPKAWENSRQKEERRLLTGRGRAACRSCPLARVQEESRLDCLCGRNSSRRRHQFSPLLRLPLPAFRMIRNHSFLTWFRFQSVSIRSIQQSHFKHSSNGGVGLILLCLLLIKQDFQDQLDRHRQRGSRHHPKYFAPSPPDL